MQHEMRLPREARQFMSESLIILSLLASDE